MEKWHPAWECVILQNIPFLEIIFFSYLCYSELWNTPKNTRICMKKVRSFCYVLWVPHQKVTTNPQHTRQHARAARSTEPLGKGGKNAGTQEFVNAQPDDTCCLGLLRASTHWELLLSTTQRPGTSVPEPVRKLMEATLCNFSPKPSSNFAYFKQFLVLKLWPAIAL